MAICLIGVTGSWGLRRASGVDRFAICIGGWVSHGRQRWRARPSSAVPRRGWLCGCLSLAGGRPPLSPVASSSRCVVGGRQSAVSAKAMRAVCSLWIAVRMCGVRAGAVRGASIPGEGARGWVMRPPRCAGVLARRGARKRVQCADAAVRVCVGGGRSPLY